MQNVKHLVNLQESTVRISVMDYCNLVAASAELMPLNSEKKGKVCSNQKLSEWVFFPPNIEICPPHPKLIQQINICRCP